jgi:GNAT superfamily N-acetyltransferase
MTANEIGKEWIIRKAEYRDIDQIVEVHMSSFPGFFLTFLGFRFLKLLYQEINAHPHGILQVAVTNSKIIGFAAGVMEQAGFYRCLIGKRKLAFAIAALNAACRRPTIAPRLIRALRKPRDVSSSTPIAVMPTNASAGIGTSLVQSFCEELRRRSICHFCLTTDRDGNDKVNNFYLTHGFELAQAFRTHEGRWMNEYVMHIK